MALEKITFAWLPGLVEAIYAAGWHIEEHSDGWYADPAADVTAFAASYDPLGDAKTRKLAALADLRWQHETGGFLFNGTVPVASDDRSKIMVSGARQKAEADSTYTLRWKVAAGEFVTLDAPTIVAISDALLAHVQACFDREDALTAEIAALADWQAVEAYDLTTGWP